MILGSARADDIQPRSMTRPTQHPIAALVGGLLLASAAHSDDAAFDLEKIAGGNFLRVYRRLFR